MSEYTIPGPSEVELLRKRYNRPYSRGHRAMYEAVAALMQEKFGYILEIGAGIGYGAQILAEKNCFSEITMVEPSGDCYDYILKNVPKFSMNLIPTTFQEASLPGEYDVSTCIEVIEHIPREQWHDFLTKIHMHTIKTLFLSTPNIETSPHGVATPKEVCAALEKAGFEYVSYFEWQWTTFFMATK